LASPLYLRQSAGLAAVYADIENHALNQGEVLVGTPGSITLRQNAGGATFYVRQYYDHEGRKKDQYIAGQADTPEAQASVEEFKKRMDEAKDVVASVRLLAREGYLTLTPRHFAAIAPLTTHGIFQAGAILVGTHAFEVIVNKLAIRAAAFATEDVDIARPSRLALENVPEGGLLELLRESGIDFVQVPGLRPKDRSTKFKEKGRSRFSFDLLVPASGDEVEVEEVPELRTHATALPYFRYLLGESQTGAVLSNHGVAAVRIPVPERFALSKMIVAQRRRGGSEKILKDLRQAAVLVAALGDLHPGSLEAALTKTPMSARKYIRKSLQQIHDQLEQHPRGWDELAAVVKP